MEIKLIPLQKHQKCEIFRNKSDKDGQDLYIETQKSLLKLK